MRKYVMIESSEEEKAEYKRAATIRPFNGVVANWFRNLAYKDLARIKKEENEKAS